MDQMPINDYCEETVNTDFEEYYEDIPDYTDFIEKADTLESLDNIYDKLKSDFEHKYRALKAIQKQNDEMKYLLNVEKDIVSGLNNIQRVEQEKTDELQKKIDAKRSELERLNEQQIEDLIEFEDEVEQISETLRNAPRDYETNALLETVSQLRMELEKNENELKQFHDEMKMAEVKAKRINVDTFTSLPVKVFEESISDMTALNEKMTHSVIQLTSKVNALRLEMGNLHQLEQEIES